MGASADTLTPATLVVAGAWREWPRAGRPAARTAGGSAPSARVSEDEARAAAAREDGALVRQAAGGDREAFGQLVRRHLAAAHGAAAALLAEATDVEDCVQDAFVAALTRIEECRPAEKFRGWLLVIVRNRAIDLQRRGRVRRAEPLDGAGASDGAGGAVVASSAPSPLAAAERADARAHLQRALATLTPTRREVVLLHDLEGWNHREIAAHLGVAEGTVRAHLFWARRALRERMSAEWRREGGRTDAP